MGTQNLKKGKPKKGESRTEHGEQKRRYNFSLTPEAIASLNELAALLEISRSELVERFARLPQNDALETLNKNSRNQDTGGGKEPIELA